MNAGPGEAGGDETDLRAAEYVLGTLPAAERDAFERERSGDPTLAAAVRGWERRLAPLSLAAPETTPPGAVWQAIAGALHAAGNGAANDNRVALLSRQVRRWRLTAAGAGLLAAGLAALVVADRPPPAPPATRYVAVVQGGGALPALVVSVDTAAGTAQVRPVSVETPNGRSLQLWYVGAGAAPKPLGLVGADASRVALPPEAGRATDGVFAVSVEPPGGSPTGQPTGQVLYTGKLIRD